MIPYKLGSMRKYIDYTQIGVDTFVRYIFYVFINKIIF